MPRGGRRKGAGRPRLSKAEKRVTLSIALKRNEVAILTDVSRQAGRSRSSVVAELIRGLAARKPQERKRRE